MMEPLPDMASHWFWLSLGMLLIAAEIVAPGFFLLWLGLAAVLTGVAAWLLPLTLALEVALFALLAVAAVYGARRWFKADAIVSEDPLLNDRAARMIGEVVSVAEAIEGGQGRVRVGDSLWPARGPDTAVGDKVRITAISGSVLLVEAL